MNEYIFLSSVHYRINVYTKEMTMKMILGSATQGSVLYYKPIIHEADTWLSCLQSRDVM